MKKKETLYIYTRISSRSQEDGSSLETQKELGIKKSKELGMDYEVRDEGTQSSSHDDLDNRPVLETLLIDVEDGLVKHLFAYNNDRLSRNKQTQHLINFRLEEKGVVLYTKDGVFDLTNPHDDLLKTFLDGISRYDNVLRTERSRIGKVHKTREQNTWLGGPAPYGYQIVDKKLCLHPEESKWVKKMYGWYYDGKSTMWIKSQLDTNGVLARRGGLFAIGSIDKLLQNTHHKGLYEWTDKKSGETIHQTCPAIVDETIWNECQERRKKVFARKSQNNATKKFYLLRNLLVCEECGSNISARTREKRDERFYYCPCKMKNWKKGALSRDKKWKRGKVGEHGCTMVRSLNIPITDKFVWDTVIDTVSNSSILKEGFKGEVLKSKFKGDKENERLLRNQKTKSKRLMKQLKLVQSSIAEVETKNLLNEYDDAEIYAGIKSNLVAELKKVKDDIEQTRIAIKELGNQNKWLDWIEKYGDDLRLKNDLSKEDKKDYLEGLIEKIGVRLDKETNDHHLTINFQMGLVGDRIEYVDQGHKSDGYEVIEGDKGEDMVISYEQVQKTHKDRRISGRYPKKKAVGALLHRLPSYPHNPITVE